MEAINYILLFFHNAQKAFFFPKYQLMNKSCHIRIFILSGVFLLKKYPKEKSSTRNRDCFFKIYKQQNMMKCQKILFNGNQFSQRCLDNIANSMRKELQSNSQFYSQYPKLTRPRLDIINIGFNAASLSYLKKKISVAQYLGIQFKVHQFVQKGYKHLEELDNFRSHIDKRLLQHFQIRQFRFPYKSSRMQELEGLISGLNNSTEVNGILFQLPLKTFREEQGKQITSLINSMKDVDCLTISNRTKVIEHKNPQILPCTPLGVMKILEEHQIDISGKIVIVAGNKSPVGLSLFHMLHNRNATVTLCNSKRQDLNKITAEADIVISAVGKPNIITTLKAGGVAIDIGVSRDFNGKLCGDICEQAKKSSFLGTPVPGGVGPLTASMMMHNTVNLWIKQMQFLRKKAQQEVEIYTRQAQACI